MLENQFPQISWLKATQIDYLTVLEAKSPKSMAVLPPEALRERFWF
jgi:hypothetical protein